MKNYLLTLTKSKKEVQTIQQSNQAYIKYNNYLQKEYFTTIEENDDFIPMDTESEIIIVLAGDVPIKAEDVFEVMEDMLYMRG